MADDSRIVRINIEDEMKSAYIDYSMSVIVARALPDVRDGLKPVHRRILYAMNDLGLDYNKAQKKSARIVGEVLGKYHPHGDGAVYDSMVRMAQEWSLRYPLVDGQGNFGSIDGDSPAAMRYTEARLERIADEMLDDINMDTVDYKLNFDDTLEEPTVLPTRVPTLLINGASGIAVGMATNMLPHNLTEVVNGTKALIDNPTLTIDDLMTHIHAPDFPTGGIIYGMNGVIEAFRTGRGKVVVRSKTEIEQDASGRETIVVTELPYQVNKAHLIKKIADLVIDEKLDGISNIQDLSDRNGLRVVVDIKKDAIASIVLSKLFKYTALQSSYGINNIALVNQRPKVLNLKQLLEEFVKFRLEVVVRRTQFSLNKAEARAHILEGLLIALDHIDEIIKIIRNSRTVEEARVGLMGRFDLSELQAKAILEMRLQKLVGLERDKIQEEYNNLLKEITGYKEILADESLQRGIIKNELDEVNSRYGDDRRTLITHAESEINIEDIIPDEDVVVTISHLGYIKRTNLVEYRQQGRGGRGSKGSKTRNEDFIEHMFLATNHNYLLLFSEKGRCHWLRIYQIPETSKVSSGRVIQNIISLPKNDKVKAYIIVEDLENQEFLDSHYIVLGTEKGRIKKTTLRAFSRPRVNGIKAITINDGDALMEARLTDGHSEILMANRNGRAIRFPESKVRPMGRTAAGVRGIRLDDDEDAVVGFITIGPDDEESSILVVSAKGNGKRSSRDAYRLTNRGGKGVRTMKVNDKTGKVVALKDVKITDDLMITNRSGVVIRLSVADLREMGRSTQGVRLIRLDDDDSIADVAVVRNQGSDEEE